MRSASFRARESPNRLGYWSVSMAHLRRCACCASGVADSTSNVASRDKPSPWASAMASPMAPRTPNTLLLATSFADAPEPGPPTRTGVPSAASGGLHRCMVCGWPPTKMRKVPDSALARLPSTGASISSTPGATTEASRATAAGPTVDNSIKAAPGRAVAATPVGPSVTILAPAGRRPS